MDHIQTGGSGLGGFLAILAALAVIVGVGGYFVRGDPTDVTVRSPPEIKIEAPKEPAPKKR
jgi:hypothetical protein